MTCWQTRSMSSLIKSSIGVRASNILVIPLRHVLFGSTSGSSWQGQCTVKYKSLLLIRFGKSPPPAAGTRSRCMARTENAPGLGQHTQYARGRSRVEVRARAQLNPNTNKHCGTLGMFNWYVLDKPPNACSLAKLTRSAYFQCIRGSANWCRQHCRPHHRSDEPPTCRHRLARGCARPVDPLTPNLRVTRDHEQVPPAAGTWSHLSLRTIGPQTAASG